MIICPVLDSYLWAHHGLLVLVWARDRPPVSHTQQRERDKRESFCVMEGKDTRRSSLESWFCAFLFVMSDRWRQPNLNTTSASHQRHVLYLPPRSRTHTLSLTWPYLSFFPSFSGSGFWFLYLIEFILPVKSITAPNNLEHLAAYLAAVSNEEQLHCFGPHEGFQFIWGEHEVSYLTAEEVLHGNKTQPLQYSGPIWLLLILVFGLARVVFVYHVLQIHRDLDDSSQTSTEGY